MRPSLPLATVAFAAALVACGSDGGEPGAAGPPPDTTPPALVAAAPAAGQAVKQAFHATATFSEPVTVKAATFRSDLAPTPRAVTATAAGATVTVDVPLVDAFGSRVHLEVQDGAGNPASADLGDWYAQPLFVEWVLPELGGPLSGTIYLWVAWAGPESLDVRIDDVPVGTLGKDLPIDTTKFGDGPHTFWFYAPGYQRTSQPFTIDNVP
ncbi:MAG: Ig-like domain-containing protein [Anaeromyxobacter sp.]